MLKGIITELFQANLDQNPLSKMRNAWDTFNQFYLELLARSNRQRLRRDLIKRPEIRRTLKRIVRILVEEDERNRESKVIGECLEYFLQHRLFEYLCAYL